MKRIFKNEAGQVQTLMALDLLDGEAPAVLAGMMANCSVVYSDPPWSPGNEKYWRTYAKEDQPREYDKFLDAWCGAAVVGDPVHVFCEQSVIEKHRAMMLRATERCEGWSLPPLEQWTVLYGNPKRPNALLHFGNEKLPSCPEGMHGEAMTREVFRGLELLGCTGKGKVIVDPCMGLGTTSRMAHLFGCDCIGTELNAARLERTIAWLTKKGYSEVEQ